VAAQYKVVPVERGLLDRGFLAEQQGHQVPMVVVEAEVLVLLGLTELPQMAVVAVQD
jgi:hypothetical protein